MYCYICKKEIHNPHFFYPNMCESCGDLNFKKRNELSNLDGYVVVITGGRVKIGYETALKFLRSNANVILTTRFPYNAIERFSKESDFSIWKSRLKIYGIDFRFTTQLYQFIDYIKINYSYVDILINNAAQTVRPSRTVIESLINDEKISKSIIDKQLCKILSNKFLLEIKELNIEQNCNNKLVNIANLVEYYQEDSYYLNSWNSKACDISPIELLEVQLINVTAPYILTTELRFLMENSPHEFKYVINVSAMEGQFSKKNKNIFHPHTNMCKAALNMFTRTSAMDFLRSKILINSVDTGWITDENPEYIKELNIANNIKPQLDEKDGASRICDPIFASVNNNINIYGKFLKNYNNTGW